MKRDIEHLKLLSLFHYVLAGMVFFFASFAIIYIIMGVAIVSGSMPPPPPGGQGMPPGIGWFFIVFFGIVLFMGYALAVCLVASGICLARRKAWTFCCVVAGMSCIWPPLGTLLGVFSLLVLMRPTVKDLFAGRIIEHDPDEEEDREHRYDPRAADRPAPRDRPARDDGQYSTP